MSLLRADWLRRRRDTLAQRILLSPLTPAAWLYGGAAALHRAAYERRWLRARRLPCCVIAVGSAVVGGTGKTPFTAWLAAQLRARGHAVAIASRGYGRQSRRPVTLVSDGERLHADLAGAGDEALWLAARCPGVPVWVGPDRGRIGLSAVARFGTRVLLLDDGLQHHRLVRDVEIALLAGDFGLGNGRVLPRGPLRERPVALRRTQALGVIDGPLPSPDAACVSSVAPAALRFVLRRRTLGLAPLDALADPSARIPLAWLAGREVGALAAIARPEALARSLAACGARVMARRDFPDHHRFRARDLRGLAKSAPLWITTEKDAVRLRSAWLRDVSAWALIQDLEVLDPDPLLDWLERRIATCSPAAADSGVRVAS